MSKRPKILHLVVIALLGLGAPACAQIVGDDFEVVHGGGATGGSSTCDNGSCQACADCVTGFTGADSSCQSEFDACNFDSFCACAATCPDSFCVDSCSNFGPDNGELGALTNCIAVHCPNSCSVSSTGGGS